MNISKPPKIKETNKGSYRILFDYGIYEGLKLQDQKFKNITDAVRYALNLNYCSPFLIIQIISWEATPA